MTDAPRFRLRHSPTSPFVRKVLAFAIETGLRDRIDLVATDPWDAATDLRDDNPLCKVPTLIRPDGSSLGESSLICAYLDDLHDGEKLFPTEDGARFAALRQLGLADGLITAAVNLVIEGRRAEGTRDDKWIDRQKLAIRSTLDVLESEAGPLTGAPVTIGAVSLGAALGYLDFRFPDIFWRDRHPALAGWFEDFSRRPSMEATPVSYTHL
ncbi:MAG TPA: glutathione S-transferase, partial [Rhodospirillum rubrum]|nr:glutathione S-transferase [Rhodospirillum rubrum]